jgi:predicted DNA-binding transcriptional regulator AlpA
MGRKQPIDEELIFIGIRHVVLLTGKNARAIYRDVAKKQFPAPVPTGVRSVGWVLAEVLAWQRDRLADREQARRAGIHIAMLPWREGRTVEGYYPKRSAAPATPTPSHKFEPAKALELTD